jgi:hypothetical protein
MLPTPHVKHSWLGLSILFFALGGIGTTQLSQPPSTPVQPSTSQPPAKAEVLNVLWEGNVNAAKPWTKIEFSVKTGDRIYLRASGLIHWTDDAAPGQNDVHPTGANYLARDVDKQAYMYPYQNAGCAALLLRINKRMYAIGDESVVVARETGPVEFGVNDIPGNLFDNSGSFHVIISSVPTRSGITVAPSETREEVADLISEQKANEHQRTNDCDCEKLPREKFGVDRWIYVLRKVGHWCTKGIHVTGDDEVKVLGPDYQDFQVLYYGEIYSSRTDWRSIFQPNRGSDTVYFSATTPMTITVTVSK